MSSNSSRGGRGCWRDSYGRSAAGVHAANLNARVFHAAILCCNNTTVDSDEWKLITSLIEADNDEKVTGQIPEKPDGAHNHIKCHRRDGVLLQTASQQWYNSGQHLHGVQWQKLFYGQCNDFLYCSSCSTSCRQSASPPAVVCAACRQKTPSCCSKLISAPLSESKANSPCMFISVWHLQKIALAGPSEECAIIASAGQVLPSLVNILLYK